MKLFRSLLTKIGILVLFFGLSACQEILGPGNRTHLATQAEEPCGFVQNSYGQRVSWRKIIPVLFYMDDTFTDKFETALREAAEVWAGTTGRPMLRFQRYSGLGKLERDGKNIISFDSEWPNKYYYQQAVTNVFWKGKEILEADIRINSKHFKYYLDGEDPGSSVHFVSLMVHEIGHALGLAHFDQIPTVMWPILDFGIVRSKPSSYDEGNLKCEY